MFSIAFVITLGSLKLLINKMRRAKTSRDAGCIARNLCGRFADIAFIPQKLIRGGLFAIVLLGVVDPIAVKAQALWIIYDNIKIKNTIPETISGTLISINLLYNAATLKSQGDKRFAEVSLCVNEGKGICTPHKAKSMPIVIAINCRDDAYLASGPWEGLPQWVPIGKNALQRNLKSAIC